jgi:excinuclease UvrABC ATPase subunit
MTVAAASDWIIDIGPGAGDEGGRIVASGLPKDVAKEPLSRTAKYLAAASEVSDLRGQGPLARRGSDHNG